MIGTVVQKGNIIYVYDEKSYHISLRHVNNGAILMGYTGTSYSVRDGDSVFIYDEKSNQISHCYI